MGSPAKPAVGGTAALGAREFYAWPALQPLKPGRCRELAPPSPEEAAIRRHNLDDRRPFLSISLLEVPIPNVQCSD